MEEQDFREFADIIYGGLPVIQEGPSPFARPSEVQSVCPHRTVQHPLRILRR